MITKYKNKTKIQETSIEYFGNENKFIIVNIHNLFN